MGDRIGDHVTNVRVSKGVDDLLTAAARGHQTRLTQRPQMLRHERLRQSRRLDELADGPRLPPDQVQQPEPRLTSENFEQLRCLGKPGFHVHVTSRSDTCTNCNI